MSFEISHSLTDGAGFLPYIKSALYLYLSRKTKDAIDPAGFRLPGDEIPESETGNPFSDLDIDGVISEMKEKGAEVLILGCTELPMAFDIIGDTGIPSVDPTDVLARAAVSFAGAPLKDEL